jgi:rSAM/selenodomain-associated transferase 2
MSSRISIIIPVLNEAQSLPETLARLAPLRTGGHEVIVVDGGSSDGTPTLAAPHADRVVASSAGRGRQMNAGAANARGDILLFLHADTVLPEDAENLVMEALNGGRHFWGRFDVRLSGDHPLLRLVAFMMNLRSRLSGIATGDQAVFVRRETFEIVGGFPDIALMEDIVISRRLLTLGSPVCLRRQVVTSSRRWQRHGIIRTIVTMWALRLAFALGVPPARLARIYGPR